MAAEPTPISDLDDPRIAIYRHLKATNATRREDAFVVEGEKLLRRLARSAYPIVSALATAREAGRIAPILPPTAPLFVVADDRIDELVGFNFHQGVLGCGARRPPIALAGLLPGLGPVATVVACPRLDNPENLGAILRVADVFGVDALIVGDRCPDPLSRRVLRVSMGSALGLTVVPSPDLAADLDRLRDPGGFRLLATVVDRDAEPVGRVARPDRLALLLGSESAGLAPEWVGRADGRVTIPMARGVDSLNVAVAAGILLHRLGAPGD